MNLGQNPQFRQGTPPGPVAKLAAFVLSVAFMVLAFMFSLVALWWKTRALRKQMQEMRDAQTMGRPQQPARSDQVIEGEFIREAGPDQRLP